MSGFVKERAAVAHSVICDGDEIVVRLVGDTVVRFPITVSAMLQVAEKQERINCKLMPGGMGIEWPDLDEHLSIQGLLDGEISRQTLESARRALAWRKQFSELADLANQD
ncbi:MAG: DUF2442 domain-containing protein [Chloroflexota bacterium]